MHTLLIVSEEIEKAINLFHGIDGIVCGILFLSRLVLYLLQPTFTFKRRL